MQLIKPGISSAAPDSLVGEEDSIIQEAAWIQPTVRQSQWQKTCVCTSLATELGRKGWVCAPFHFQSSVSTLQSKWVCYGTGQGHMTAGEGTSSFCSPRSKIGLSFWKLWKNEISLHYQESSWSLPSPDLQQPAPLDTPILCTSVLYQFNSAIVQPSKAESCHCANTLVSKKRIRTRP